MTVILGALWNVAKIAIPVPLVVIALAFGWWQIDKTSAVRRAVDDALTEAVAGAKIAALEARIVENERQLAAGRKAAEGFAELLRQAQLREAQQAAIDAEEDADYEAELAAAGRSCGLSTDDLDWLRR
ncbi:hypothetical protein [Mesorhizobium sp. KR9-304]|uniref:hypothetical protein n=1 Tax=Mesorhizobium sp. KR9-304 TaxID=3156614 RepID=UPI0032B5C880